MAAKLSEKIDRLLREGKDKHRILRDLENSENREEVVFLLNDLPTAQKRQKFLPVNLILAALLAVMTGLKIRDAIAIGQPNIYFFLALVVPLINIYVLKKILRFRRTGFLYLLVLSVLALFQPQNHRILELTLLIAMLFLSGFLYLRLFPKAEMISLPGQEKK